MFEYYRFTNKLKNREVWAVPKCGLSSMTALLEANEVFREPRRAEPCGPQVAIVRHPKRRVESFIKDKCWREPVAHGKLTQLCQTKFKEVLDTPEAKRRLWRGQTTIDDILDALESGYVDDHLLPVSAMVPEVDRTIDMDCGFFPQMIQAELYVEFPHLNKTEGERMEWTDRQTIRLFELYRSDFCRFGFRLDD